MQSRWSDDETRSLTGLDLLVYASRLIGAETSLVVWGGGNTSLKVTESGFHNHHARVLRVKGSGSDLKSIARKDFPGIWMDDLLPLLARDEMTDEEMVAHLAKCLVEPNAPRPSIETLLHGFVPADAVIHTHADAIVALTNTDRGREVIHRVYGNESIFVPYRRPGFRLSKEVAEAARAHPEARGVILEKHGLITWGGTLKEAYLGTIEMVSRAEAHIEEAGRGGRVLGAVRVASIPVARRRELAAVAAPILRGAVSQERRAILHFDDSEKVLEFVGSEAAPTLSQIGPATPDHVLYTKPTPLFVPATDPTNLGALSRALSDGVETYVRQYAAYFEAHRSPEMPMLEPAPRVILIPGLGMFTTGKNKRSALIAADIYRHTISVLRAASGIGRYTSLTAAEVFGVEYWPLELYKLTLAPPEKELARRVALVTGGASGIGRAVAARLAQEGAHVVVGDIDAAGARKVAEEITQRVGAGSAIGVAMDVTRQESVREEFAAACLEFGGLDIVVSNAGIAPTATLDGLSLEDWERSLAVNATGHFLVVRESLRVLKAQGLGGSLIFVVTKNVLAPGRELGAYAAAKAAEATLARVLAIEGGPYGIRSNIVNPDAVFQDSRLWSESVRRDRAHAHGVPPEELEEFYRKRNLLGVRILPEDVAEAVLFLASDRSAKTTGCILTVDGGVRDAFPR